jgi:hypothetical protein
LGKFFFQARILAICEPYLEAKIFYKKVKKKNYKCTKTGPNCLVVGFFAFLSPYSKINNIIWEKPAFRLGPQEGAKVFQRFF